MMINIILYLKALRKRLIHIEYNNKTGGKRGFAVANIKAFFVEIISTRI